jgi:hypothetical protein
LRSAPYLHAFDVVYVEIVAVFVEEGDAVHRHAHYRLVHA